jgi:hypothetical protein
MIIPFQTHTDTHTHSGLGVSYTWINSVEESKRLLIKRGELYIITPLSSFNGYCVLKNNLKDPPPTPLTVSLSYSLTVSLPLDMVSFLIFTGDSML